MPTLFYPTCTCISAHPGLNTNIKRALEKPLKWSTAKLRHARLCHLCRYTFFLCHTRDSLLEALIPWLIILLPKRPCFKNRCCSLSWSLINILFYLSYSRWCAKSVLHWRVTYKQFISNICVHLCVHWVYIDIGFFLFTFSFPPNSEIHTWIKIQLIISLCHFRFILVPWGVHEISLFCQRNTSNLECRFTVDLNCFWTTLVHVMVRWLNINSQIVPLF